MFNSRIDLFQQEWIDAIFEGRNKAYGAYDLRRRESGMTVKALIIGAVVFSLLVSLPLIVRKIGERIGTTREVLTEKITVVELPPPPPPREDTYVPPPPAREVQSIKDIKKFTSPVVGPAEDVTEELATQKELETADAGSRNVDASADGEVVIDEKPVDHPVEKRIVEDVGIYSVQSVQVSPEYPGGRQKFIEYVMANLGGIELESTLRMKFRFVIEKDGSLTDIKVISDGGQPLIADRVVKVLGKSKKWSPGVNNGKPVRVMYDIPITVQVLN